MRYQKIKFNKTATKNYFLGLHSRRFQLMKCTTDQTFTNLNKYKIINRLQAEVHTDMIHPN